MTKLPGTEARFRGSNERVVASNGEINAGSKKELMQRLVEIANMVQDGHLETETASTGKVSERQAVLAAAYNDKDGRQWSELGSAVAADLAEVADRDGFARNLLQRVDIASNGVPQVDVKQLNTTAVIATSPSTIAPQFLRNKKLFPPEFEVIANLLVDERDIAQGPADILAQKFVEGQQQIQVTEDRLVKKGMDAMVDSSAGNQLQIFGSSFTPSNLGTLTQNVLSHNLQPVNCLLAADVFTDIMTNGDFSNWFDPVSRYEIVTTGNLGRLMGMSVRSDAYREPLLRVLNKGEIFVTAAPEYTGAITDRGPIQSKEVPTNRAARGWFLWELISLTLHNPRAVAKGYRT